LTPPNGSSTCSGAQHAETELDKLSERLANVGAIGAVDRIKTIRSQLATARIVALGSQS
jgi:hypothetical protein